MDDFENALHAKADLELIGPVDVEAETLGSRDLLSPIGFDLFDEVARVVEHVTQVEV